MYTDDAGGNEVSGVVSFDLASRPRGVCEVGQDARVGSRGGDALPRMFAGLRECGRWGGRAGWRWWCGGGVFACGLGKAVLASC